MIIDLPPPSFVSRRGFPFDDESGAYVILLPSTMNQFGAQCADLAFHIEGVGRRGQ